MSTWASVEPDPLPQAAKGRASRASRGQKGQRESPSRHLFAPARCCAG